MTIFDLVLDLVLALVFGFGFGHLTFGLGLLVLALVLALLFDFGFVHFLDDNGRRRKKKTQVFCREHFDLVQPNMVKCMICQKQLSYSNNTSSMLCHLHSLHPNVCPSDVAAVAVASTASYPATPDVPRPGEGNVINMYFSIH